jgi:hypothetical protein
MREFSMPGIENSRKLGGDPPIETLMDSIAAVEARIQQIRSMFVGSGAGGRLGASATAAESINPTSFADVLGQAQGVQATTPSDPTQPTSSGTLNKAGVDPVKWSRDFLTKLGMPITAENMRAMQAWQQAEGTAAQFNPLATTQGGYPGETNFNSVGVKNFTSYEDGLAANVKVIQNGLYGNILAALQKGNNAMDVAAAIKNSPWGSGALVERILSQQAS